MNSRTAVITALTATLLSAFYIIRNASQKEHQMRSTPTSSENTVGLVFRLSQISKSPPSLLVTLQNNSPSSTFTILKWGTPLDPQAQNLGIFKLEDAATGKEVPVDRLMVQRKLPPSRDELQEIAPGTEHAIEVVLDKPWMPQTKPAKYKVRVEGEFKGVWEKAASEVKAEELESFSSTPFSSQSYESHETILVVE